ncbi:hypothetical protein QL285_073007 [Trifolium repens]|nr:hypothetical protein QL285_073007 [Trifolium repens]
MGTLMGHHTIYRLWSPIYRTHSILSLLPIGRELGHKESRLRKNHKPTDVRHPSLSRFRIAIGETYGLFIFIYPGIPIILRS